MTARPAPRLALAALAALAGVASVGLLATVAAAHPLGPSSLQVEEQAPGVATARFQSPVAAGLAVRWPAACTRALVARAVAGAEQIERFTLDCRGRALAGAEIGVDGLGARDTIAIVRVRLADGRVARDVLGPAHPAFIIPGATPWTHTLAAYVRLGIDHLLGGADHILFVLGLLLVVTGWRARALTLTAFTAGHSVTLALAALGAVRVPPAPVEALIALTLIVVAVQAIDPPRHPARDPRTRGRRTWMLAAGFGAIHGLGFAGALTAAGLPSADIPLALAGFNLGLELAQLALAAAAVVVLTVAASLARPWLAAPARVATAYAIGGLAAMWCLERSWAVVGPF